jgi:two-component system, cell cycle sensor histidine kinase and response regulator CckA
MNASDAISDNGKIIISTANATIDESMKSGNMNVAPGSYVKLTVQDTGIGMDAQTQSRIFEPFFTTKPLRKGTGLGLATVYGIVKQNKGTIWVYSEPKKGSIFRVYLPLSNQQTQTKSEVKTVTLDKSSLNKVVLVVEDQAMLREAISNALLSGGFKVHKASNGVEALELYKNIGQVDLVVTDVIMPEMGGPVLAKRLSALGASAKILFLSGYTDEVLDKQELAGQHTEFLEKPFSRADLLNKVKTLLLG